MPLRRSFESLLRESRAPLEIARFLLSARSVSDLPRGDGHTVMFLPAFTLDDREFQPMARAVERLGYATCGWSEGRNLGLRRRTLERLITRVSEFASAANSPLSLVGWSGGGLYAREIARAVPDCVRRVITLGCPIHLSEAAPWYVDRARRGTNLATDAIGYPSFEPILETPPVPCTAIYSKRDGVVDWRAAMEPEGPLAESIEVDSSHLGLGYSLEVLRIAAERLALAG